MTEPSSSSVLKELHRDLRRKYRLHGSKVQQIWRGLSQGERAKAMKAGAADGIVLKHPLDSSLENVCKFIPEWNLRDITAPSSDFFLDLLKHRATTSLEEQYHYGFNGRPGDHDHIIEMMRTRNLRHVDTFKDCYTLFLDGGRDEYEYGRSYRLVKDHDETLAAFAPAIRAGVFIPQSAGELILTRQIYMCQLLNIMIEDVLDVGSTSRSQQERPKKSGQSVSSALSTLAIAPSKKPGKVELPVLISNALDRKSFVDEYLGLLCTEPVVLAHEVNIWFFSRPELIADERGRTLPAHTDKYISSALVEAVHSAVNTAAIWNYICRLLELLRGATHKAHQATLLQEISNMCHLEYARAQSMLKRHVATGTGSKWFRRISNSPNSRLILKGDPELLTRENPQLHYLLRLCQTETNASKAVHWVQKLDDLHRSHPSEREALQEREADSLCDLAIIVGFMQSLSLSVAIPPFNRKKGQFFASGAAELGAELDQIKKKIDLTDFAAPIENLLEPGMAENALKSLDQCILDDMGTKMGFLYEDLITDCTLRLEERAIKDKADQQAKAESMPLPSETTPQPREVRIQERKQKEKTRPTHSSIYEITPQVERSVEGKTAESMKTLIVKSATAETFYTLFSKSEARGSVPWTAFEAAMADLGFSIIPEYGSVYTFAPPANLGLQKSIKLHRPHQARIEGHRLLFLASRLSRNYGWTSKSFQVA
ncbi:hypothetical protein F5Y06DRAFT_113039 [Hypoxylon sp. FL0890]|nr:hypothetical protein F5Y06DRAFT_113039 [Hypoxylon sp. FL0890]